MEFWLRFVAALAGVWPCLAVSALHLDPILLTNFTTRAVRTTQAVLFACQPNELLRWTSALVEHNQMVVAVQLRTPPPDQDVANWTAAVLGTHLSRHNHARTAIILDCGCSLGVRLLPAASEGRYFNRTYQWLLWDAANLGVDALLADNAVDYMGPNAQVTLVNASADGATAQYWLWDVHTKGRHLQAPFEVALYAEYNVTNGRRSEAGTWHWHEDDVFRWQGISRRDQFHGLRMRGATVIDLDDVTTNEQIEAILARPSKDSGVAAFTKYHYELMRLVRARLNFTVNFRNARGWAGRLGDTRYRLGYLGIMMRNEADIGASGAFNRINRFAEFDIIHQSWKFETAFLYRFTPDLDAHGKSGNFLAPFDDAVWLLAGLTFLGLSSFWRLVEFMRKRWRWRMKHRKQQQRQRQREQGDRKNDIHETACGRRRSRSISRGNGECRDRSDDNSDEPTECLERFNADDSETSLISLTLKTFAAFCQQGMEPLPSGVPSRAIIITTFLCSLMMYNYYTSSVVGGLLSSTVEGPATVDEVVSSSLQLAFEDIGYYKVLFRENKTPMVLRLIARKVEPARSDNDLPIYTHLQEAIPFLKRGHVGFHCEVVDAYPEIAKHFDANEICELRVVSGLLETEIMNWIVHKNSQYADTFRIVMCRAREVGLVERLLRQRQPKKPICQAVYMVYPVGISGVLSAFLMLAGGAVLGILSLMLERYRGPKRNLIKSKHFTSGKSSQKEPRKLTWFLRGKK